MAGDRYLRAATLASTSGFAQEFADVSSKAKIVHVIDTLGSGGAERALVTNLRSFDRERYEHTVVMVWDDTSPGRANARFWETTVRDLGVEVVSLGVRSKYDLALGLARLVRILADERAALVHTHLLWADLLGRVAARAVGARVVSSIHSLSSDPDASVPLGAGSLKHRFLRQADRLTARATVDELVCVSSYVATRVAPAMGVPSDRVRVVYNPLDIVALDHAPRVSRDALLAQLALDADAEVILNVGRLTPEKDQVTAVRAMATILASRPRAHLLLVGHTLNRAVRRHVERAARESGVAAHVHFVGETTDVASWLRACDVFVFPSLSEGLGMALSEAMASGCACVAADCGPLPELLVSPSVGVLVPPRDPASLARAVVELLADPKRRRSLGIEASDYARRMFDPDRVARALEDVYAHVLAD